MAKSNDPFGERFEPIEASDFNAFIELSKVDRSRRDRKRREDKLNEVGKVPELPPEIIELRKKYRDDYVAAHRDIFVTSTGIKPYSEEQILSIKHSQQVFQRGGRVCKAEPRGFAKTSRSCNEGLLGVLEGFVSYLLIIGSNVDKAGEIINSIITEIMENEMIFKMYPAVVKCFRHIQANKNKAGRQTYDGELTHIYYNDGLIKFPVIPGEPSSGAIINVRPLKNVRGIYFTDEGGPYAGKRRRPSHVILDDVQTDEDADSQLTVKKIVNRIKKSILRSQGHNKRIGAIMNGTPIEPGDVTHHFLLNEPGWNRLMYPMLKSRAKNEDLWLVEYASLLLDFNKDIPQSAEQAAIRARDFYIEHRQEMDEGAEATWEWCYEYDDDPQLEISAIQHAYNIMILEGMDVFESECQCNVMSTVSSDDITFCTADHITNKTHRFKRHTCSVNCRHIISHIDVNQDYLTYTTIATPRNLEAMCIDWGSYPSYGTRFAKKKMAETIHTVYRDIEVPEDRIYQAIKDLINILGKQIYHREDGIELMHDLILVDMGFKTDWVYKAIRDCNFRNITHPMQGESYRAKDKGIADKRYSEQCTKYHYTVLVPCNDGVLQTLISDVNYMKTQLHIGFSRELGTTGCVSLFAPEQYNQHSLLGEHCTAELPSRDVDPKTKKELTIWNALRSRDNELFDNLVGCLSGASKLGVDFAAESQNHEGTINVQEFINAHR